MTQTDLQKGRAFGKGLALTPIDATRDIGLDIQFTTPSAPDAPRDLVVMSGLPVLLQDLTVALSTGLGTDPLNIGFGSGAFEALAEQSDPFMRREAVKVAVIRVLSADPRVRRVLDIRVNDDPLEAGARRTQMSLTVVFDTILQERASIDVEGIPYG